MARVTQKMKSRLRYEDCRECKRFLSKIVSHSTDRREPELFQYVQIDSTSTDHMFYVCVSRCARDKDAEILRQHSAIVLPYYKLMHPNVGRELFDETKKVKITGCVKRVWLMLIAYETYRHFLYLYISVRCQIGDRSFECFISDLSFFFPPV